MIANAGTEKPAALIDRETRELPHTHDMGGDGRHTVTVEMVGTGEPDVNDPPLLAKTTRAVPASVE